MTRLWARVLLAVVILIGLAPVTRSQQDDQKPLGDVAREQRKEQDQKTHPKVFHNRDIASPDEAGEAKGQPSPSPTANASASANRKNDETKSADSKKRPVVVDSSSIFDRPRSPEEEAADNFVTVPAGTAIPIDLLRSNVSEPVRLGFATPIPALSQAEVRFIAAYYYYGYDSYYDDEDAVPTCSAQLTALTLGGVRYPVQTDPTPTTCVKAGDITFTLTAPLKIAR